MPEAEQSGATELARPEGDRRRVGVVLVDFESRKVSIEFDAAFYQLSLDDQASIVGALIGEAVNAHIDIQDDRVDALTAAPVAEWDKPPEGGEAAFFDADGAAMARSDL
jgi:hypothetical protein